MIDRNEGLAVGSRVGVYLGVLVIGMTTGIILTTNVTVEACNTVAFMGDAPAVCRQWLPTFSLASTVGALVGGALLLGGAYLDQRVVDWEAIE